MHVGTPRLLLVVVVGFIVGATTAREIRLKASDYSSARGGGLPRFHICDIPGICKEGEECVKDGKDALCREVSLCKEDSCPEYQTCTENPDAKTITCVCPGGTTEHEEGCVEFCDLPRPCPDPLMECVTTNTSYDCVCPEGYTERGENCVPVCLTAPCPLDMECLLDHNDTISCLCPAGEITEGPTGAECEPACTENSCPANMKCSALIDGFSCSCGRGYSLTAEEECKPECQVEPCSDGEICVSFRDNYRCCAPGMLPDPESGDCKDACSLPGICEEGLECRHVNDSFSCDCPNHKLYDGETGVCADFCDFDVCDAGMVCSSGPQGFSCECQGDSCKRCEDNPCLDSMVCVQGEFQHTCTCDTGYSLIYGECVDDDECAEDEPCDEGAQCINTPGGFMCMCPGNTYYNDSSSACNGYNECTADACDTTHTGMICQETTQGFACICPPGFPEESCAQGLEPCSCSENERCVPEESGTEESGAEGQENETEKQKNEAVINYYCACDDLSIMEITPDGGTCVPNPDVLDAAEINAEVTEYTLTLGQRRMLRVQIANPDRAQLKGYPVWKLVTWTKLPGMVITSGARKTPLGHYTTPNNRQLLVINEVRPEDGGLYRVEVQRPGYKTISKTIKVTVAPPLIAKWGPREGPRETWSFLVKVNGNFKDAEVTWYRVIGEHVQLLIDAPSTCRIERDGQLLTVSRVPGLYIARFRGTLRTSGAVIQSEVGFRADHVTTDHVTTDHVTTDHVVSGGDLTLN